MYCGITTLECLAEFRRRTAGGTLYIGGTVSEVNAMGFRDMDLNDDVRACLRKDRELSGCRIDVDVRNGIVYLKGSLSVNARDHALAVARGVNAVAAVIDQMTVR